MKNEGREIREEKDEILKIYERFYEKLFETRVVETDKEKEQEVTVRKKIQEIMQKAKDQQQSRRLRRMDQ